MLVQPLTKILNLFLILFLLLSSLLFTPAPVSAAPLDQVSPGLSPENLLQPGGRLKVTGTSRSINLSGWSENQIARRSPVISPKSIEDPANWLPFKDGEVIGTDGSVLALAVSDGYIYAGGCFKTAGECTQDDGCKGIARWDGSQWSPIGKGIDGCAYAIAADGSDLYVAGEFYSATQSDGTTTCDDCRNIAKWDGTQWLPLGPGLNNKVRAIAINGSTVYVGGLFNKLYDDTCTECAMIAQWDGESWSALGKGLDHDVNSIAIDSLGNVYVGGNFHNAFGVTSAGDCDSTDGCNNIVKWNNASGWSPLGTGITDDGGIGYVYAIAINDTGIYVGGLYNKAGDCDTTDGCNNIARWSGGTWSALGKGTDNTVNSITISGSDLFAGGHFGRVDNTPSDQIPAKFVAKWNSASGWAALGSGLDWNPNVITHFGTDIIFGGDFYKTGDNSQDFNYIAAYANSASIPVTVPSDGQSLAAGEDTLSVQFNKPVLGDDSDYSATALKNYMLVGAGKDGTFQTLDTSDSICAESHTPLGDDVNISIASIHYDQNTFTATLTIAPTSLPLATSSYRLYVCGKESVHDLFGQPINSGANFTLNFTATAPPIPIPSNPASGSTFSKKKTTNLPKTGFAPNRKTSLPAQSAALAYAKLSNLWLEIPSQNIKAEIVGVPQVNNNWDVSWLGKTAGWLNGTAFPTWLGNSVITAHVTDANGKPGPFAEIRNLSHGANIIVHLAGEKYTYEVRDTRLVFPDTTSYAFEHLGGRSYLTLITCQGYNFLTDSYMFRRVVRAVLMKVETE